MIYTFQQLCEYLHIGKDALYKLIENKKIKYFKIGKYYRFTQSMVDEYIQSEVRT
jgi:excisionase family DNA binding protein